MQLPVVVPTADMMSAASLKWQGDLSSSAVVPIGSQSSPFENHTPDFCIQSPSSQDLSYA